MTQTQKRDGVNPFNIKKFKTGDTVVVTTGKDKGKEGKILAVLRNINKVKVGGLNMATDFNQKDESKRRKEMPIHISNIMHIDPASNKPTRVGFAVNEDNVKTRVAKASGQVI